jgi:hypothetical protein
MTNDPSKFVLSAYRPGGGDQEGPAFADALRAAAADPELRAWFERSRAHDAAVAAKLRSIEPPQGLRESILAGAAAGAGGRGAGWGWLAGLAASAAFVAGVFSFSPAANPPQAASAFANFAVDDMLTEQHGGRGEPSAALIGRLESPGAPMPKADELDFPKLEDTGCRTLRFGGRPLVEVCFMRNGTLFHLYMMPRGGSEPLFPQDAPSYVSLTGGTAAVWSDRGFNYALASEAGASALRRLF